MSINFFAFTSTLNYLKQKFFNTSKGEMKEKIYAFQKAGDFEVSIF